jgi:nucleotide-binding universal stress UspA family protein
MAFVVPFDGSELAEAALVRAVEYGAALDEEIAAVVVVPERKQYAREKVDRRE